MSFLVQVGDMRCHIAAHILRREEFLEAQAQNRVPLPWPHLMPDNPCGFCGGPSNAGVTLQKPRFLYLELRDVASANLYAYPDAGRCMQLLLPHG